MTRAAVDVIPFGEVAPAAATLMSAGSQNQVVIVPEILRKKATLSVKVMLSVVRDVRLAVVQARPI